MTPVLCCGFECGIAPGVSTTHLFGLNGTSSFSTTTVRTGLRSIRVNPTAGTGSATINLPSTANVHVRRFAVRFAALPDATTNIGNPIGAWFNVSDSKIYAGEDNGGPVQLGATGVSVTTGQWYVIDVRADISANPWLIDVQVNGVACGQRSSAIAAASFLAADTAGVSKTCTTDAFFDDYIVSFTAADYPIGDGYVLSYIPNEDGTHNIAGASDFFGGTNAAPKNVDLNGRTDAYTYVDERPLPTTSVDFVNGVAPPNSTDYVEVAYENSAESIAPQAVEGIVVWHDASGAGTHNFQLTLRDSGGGTTANIIAAGARNVGATITYGRAHFATIPGGGAWTLAAFNALRSRFLVSDASPDVYIDALMLEADYRAHSLPSMHRSYRNVLLRR